MIGAMLRSQIALPATLLTTTCQPRPRLPPVTALPRSHAREVWLAEHGSQPAAVGRLAAALALAAALLGPAVEPAAAYNVRVEDVESPALQAGLVAANQGRYDEAERFFEIYLQQEPGSASAWSNLGNVHLSMGYTERAIADFSKAIELAPEAAVPYLNRAVAREQLGVERQASGAQGAAAELWGAALADCDAAVERDPQEFAAWFDRGNIAMRLGRYDQALTDFRTAANLAPGLAGYRLREATLLFQQGEPESARTMMQGLVRKYGNYAEARVALAAVDWAQGYQGKAEEEYEKATRMDARWEDMGFIRANTRWPPALYEAMERFLAISPAS